MWRTKCRQDKHCCSIKCSQNKNENEQQQKKEKKQFRLLFVRPKTPREVCRLIVVMNTQARNDITTQIVVVVPCKHEKTVNCSSVQNDLFIFAATTAKRLWKNFKKLSQLGHIHPTFT